MKLHRFFKSLFYYNGWASYDALRASGVTVTTVLPNTEMIYTDKNGDEWGVHTGTTSPTLYVSYTTSLTIGTVPYIGGTSAYTYQMTVVNQDNVNVISECSFVSKNTQVASVSSVGLITGVYTGSTLISVIHPKLLPAQTSSNTFIVNQIVTSITPYVTSITGGTGLTYSALTYKDQWNNTIISNNVTRSGYSTGIVTISPSTGVLTFGYTGTTYITAASTYGSGSAVTTVKVTASGV